MCRFVAQCGALCAGADVQSVRLSWERPGRVSDSRRAAGRVHLFHAAAQGDHDAAVDAYRVAWSVVGASVASGSVRSRASCINVVMMCARNSGPRVAVWRPAGRRRCALGDDSRPCSWDALCVPHRGVECGWCALLCASGVLYVTVFEGESPAGVESAPVWTLGAPSVPPEAPVPGDLGV